VTEHGTDEAGDDGAGPSVDESLVDEPPTATAE